MKHAPRTAFPFCSPLRSETGCLFPRLRRGHQQRCQQAGVSDLRFGACNQLEMTDSLSCSRFSERCLFWSHFFMCVLCVCRCFPRNQVLRGPKLLRSRHWATVPLFAKRATLCAYVTVSVAITCSQAKIYAVIYVMFVFIRLVPATKTN